MIKRVLQVVACGAVFGLSMPVVGQVAADDKVKAAAAEEETQAKKKDKPKWDVQSPPGEWRDIPIDVREGTWMNIDVSPDGNTIVFDLLGDIYEIDIDGGEARPITSGVAWDMQPRFSPDGGRIAFTSDRGGGDNIWVVTADGANPVEVTKETYTLLNGPAWTPDGEWIVARKHFTSRRSLGAGEVWLYRADGSATGGLQLTTRPTDQKDVNEPVFSPCGRYLYYSWDATPGGSFQYSKDSNGQIYIISRLDREKGETEEWITGPGGAVRPTPSRDGKQLAFVRRDRFKTCLFVQDVKSGAVRKVMDGLERDMQEAWAIHGVFPVMAWIPGDKEVVTWTGGKLWRVDMATGAMKEIPFHIEDTRKVAAEAVRFPVEVAPTEFDVRMVRWSEVSPKADRVVFQALGKLYVRELKGDGTVGEARRLTQDEDNFEYYPSFSRDGERVVYTTWNEKDLGSVRVVSADGGTGKAVTDVPGFYTDPAFSPDGSRVVFGKISGGWLLGQVWTGETGVFWATSAGGDMERITRRGTNPQFGTDNDRVFLTVSEPDKENDNTKLISMTLDGAEVREHFKTSNGTEFKVSPDGRWVAFVERFNAYITPFFPTGRCVDVGPKAKSQPVAKASADAGNFVHWGGDSTRLHWTLGPDLFTLEVARAFEKEAKKDDQKEVAKEDGESRREAAVTEQKDEKKIEEKATKVAIGFTHQAAKPSAVRAFVGAKVLTMADGGAAAAGSIPGPIVENGVVVVEGNRIVAVGDSASTKIPPGAEKIDCTGMVLMPGMVDVHAHGPQGHAGIIPQRNWFQYGNLAFGVTTIHDPSNDTQAIFAASELQRAGMIVGPRIYSTGTILYGAAGSYKAQIDSQEDAEFHLRRMKAQGAISVKSYNQPRRDQRQQVLEGAKKVGIMVVPEGGSLFQHNMTMVVDGHTGVEHSLPVEGIYDDVVQLWSATKTGYTPTLVVGYGGMEGEMYWYQHTNVWENERLMRFVPRAVVDPQARRRQMAPEEEYNTLRSSKICKKLNDAGVTVHIGAHGQMAGIAAHWELWMLGQGGMSPMQALRCATLEGAKYIGMDHDIGSIEVGKLADLIVLEKDPTADLRNSDSIRYTMVNGRLFDAQTMDELWKNGKKCEPFYFRRMMGWGSVGASGAERECGGCGRVGCGETGPGGDVPLERAYR